MLARPIPGKWSTQECVSHLADTEIFFTDRIVRTVAMDRPLLMSADEKLYIERLNYQAFDFAEQLALFTALRRHAARTANLLATSYENGGVEMSAPPGHALGWLCFNQNTGRTLVAE